MIINQENINKSFLFLYKFETKLIEKNAELIIKNIFKDNSVFLNAGYNKIDRRMELYFLCALNYVCDIKNKEKEKEKDIANDKEEELLLFFENIKGQDALFFAETLRDFYVSECSTTDEYLKKNSVFSRFKISKNRGL